MLLLLLSPGKFEEYILSFLITNPKLVGFLQVWNIYKNKLLYLICMYIFHTNFDIYICLYTYIYFFYIFLFSELFWRVWKKRPCFINVLLMHNSVWHIAGVWYPVIELKWILLKRRRENVLSHLLFPAVWGFEYELRNSSAFEPFAYQLYVPEPFNLSELQFPLLYSGTLTPYRIIS